jgi:hypothetical protein
MKKWIANQPLSKKTPLNKTITQTKILAHLNFLFLAINQTLYKKIKKKVIYPF